MGGVLTSLVEKHFPAPDRGKISKLLGIGKQTTILDDLGIDAESNKNGKATSQTGNGSSEDNGKRKPRRQAAMKCAKKAKIDYGDASDENDSEFELSGDEEEEDEEDEESEASESDFNPFGSDSESDGDDPWERRG